MGIKAKVTEGEDGGTLYFDFELISTPEKGSECHEETPKVPRKKLLQNRKSDESEDNSENDTSIPTTQ